ncbi:DUF7151 family protein [Flagellimonas flava]|nr:hypothetical protein [Allomuricauda flava]
MRQYLVVGYLLIALALLISCQPEDGEDGVSGLSSITLFSQETPGDNCQFGGIRIDTGLDSNSNFTLESGEIGDTKFVCGGIEDPISKETRIVLHNNNSGASGTSGDNINVYPAIIKFDKRSWDNLSSIIYTASIKSDNSGNRAIVDLYDATNFEIIENTELSTSSTEYVNVISDNLLDAFPESEIDIHLRLKSENVTDDNVWISNKSELIIKQINQ